MRALPRLMLLLGLLPLTAAAQAPQPQTQQSQTQKSQGIDHKAESVKAPTATQKLHAMVYHAAKTDNVELLEAFVAHRGDPNFAHTAKQYTPLMVAAYYGHARSVDLLLKGGADPCARDRRGNTALMGAIFKGHFKISERLMGNDCAVKGRNAAQQTPLMFAALFGRSDTVAALVARGAKVDARDHTGQTAMDLARGQANTQMLALLTRLADD